MKRCSLFVLFFIMLTHWAVAQMESDSAIVAQRHIQKVAAALNVSEIEAIDMLKKADEVLREVQSDFTQVAAFSTPDKRNIMNEAIDNFRSPYSKVETSNKQCQITAKPVGQYLTNLSRKAYRINANQIMEVTLRWGEDAKVGRVKTLVEGRKYKITISVWQFYLKHIMQEIGYSLPVPTSAYRSTTSTDPDWVDAHEIDDNTSSQTSNYIASFNDILTQASGLNLKYSDVTMKTFILVCEKNLHGEWNVKIERVSASCALDLATYERIRGRRN